jgi:hypothetical protein
MLRTRGLQRTKVDAKEIELQINTSREQQEDGSHSPAGSLLSSVPSTPPPHEIIDLAVSEYTMAELPPPHGYQYAPLPDQAQEGELESLTRAQGLC